MPPAPDRSIWNRSRFVRGERAGHYESYFQRANHPSRPLAFWIRYTVFCPRGRPGDAVGELWAIYFDGETGRIAAAKEDRPLADCDFSSTDLNVRLGAAELHAAGLRGQAASRDHTLAWDLTYAGEAPPLLLLPPRLYRGGFPKAKALVGTPHAVYEGALTVDGEAIPIDGWVGSQNHNWGSRHTDEYAWGQVAGFDGRPDAFLECSTARVRIGPFYTPWLTLVVLRLGETEIALNSLAQGVRARGRYDFFTWRFDSRTPAARIAGLIEAPRSAFVGLTYRNPPGGAKTCLNTKLARCQLTVERPGQPAVHLSTQYRTAFEILTESAAHGVPLVA